MSAGHCEESEYRGASNRFQYSAERYVAAMIRFFRTLTNLDLIASEKQINYLFIINKL